MNSRAVELEKGYGKSIMSSFHAFYSLAGFISAGVIKVTSLLNIPLSKWIYINISVLVIMCLLAISFIKNIGSKNRLTTEKEPLITLPQGVLIGLSFIVCLAFISEGAIGNWVAIFLNKEQGLSISSAAMGYGLFSICMAIGRLFGDSVSRKFGQINTLKFSSIFSGLTLIIAVITPFPTISLVFIGLLGFGMANIIPILFSMAGNSGIMSPSKGIASVSMIGYAGFIIGPPLMGFIGELILLRYALLIIVFFCFIIALSVKKIIRKPNENVDLDKYAV